MIELKLPEEKIIRIKEFLNSSNYKNNTVKKSELWRHESSLSKIEFKKKI